MIHWNVDFLFIVCSVAQHICLNCVRSQNRPRPSHASIPAEEEAQEGCVNTLQCTWARGATGHTCIMQKCADYLMKITEIVWVDCESGEEDPEYDDNDADSGQAEGHGGNETSS